MISRKTFATLRAGDIVLFNGTPRTVLDGPGDKPTENCKAIDLAIMRRSWAQRAVTVYLWNDVKHKIRVMGCRAKSIILKSEWKRLEAIRFDPRRELRRQVEDEIAVRTRMKRQICSRLRKLAERCKRKEP